MKIHFAMGNRGKGATVIPSESRGGAGGVGTRMSENGESSEQSYRNQPWDQERGVEGTVSLEHVVSPAGG